MTKEQIIKLYIADLNNLVADSDAKTNRIIDLEDELESIKRGQSLPIDGVIKSYSEKNMDDAYDKGYNDGVNAAATDISNSL
jgi:hypothetical protein